MNETIQWPDGEFTIKDAAKLNSAVPEAQVRKKLSTEIAAKRMTQTQKGDGKKEGKFQVVK